MIVNLTRSQHACIDDVVDRETEPLLWDALHRDVVGAGKGKRIEVTAPYVAWEIVKDRLMRKHLTRSLGRSADTPLKVLSLLRAIAKAQNRFDRHPAMRGMAMMGWHDGWFPVWGIDHIYSAMPNPGVPFVVLMPVLHQAHRGMTLTTWQPGRDHPAHWLADEHSHTCLLTEHR